MMTVNAVSKCPSCGKECKYTRVVSCNSNTPIETLQFYFDMYIKECECGTEFNIEENNVKDIMTFDIEKLQPDINKIRSDIKNLKKKLNII